MKKTLYFLIAYLTFCASTFLHEYAHSFFAVIFKIKESVLDIHYSYLPFLFGIHEKVNYDLAALLPSWQAILISGSGLLANLLGAFLGFICLWWVEKKSLVFTSFAFIFFNISDWFNYLTIRNIFPRGDIANMIQFGFPSTLLLILGIASSVFLTYLLFFPVRRMTFKKLGFYDEAGKEFTSTMVKVFIFMQVGEIYNSLLMY